MCGISGVFGRGDVAAVNRMLSALAHRGPDDEFCVGSSDFALGARRLSIIDLEGGRQPLCNEVGNVWAAQNGELYNFPELRPRLVAAGHVLRTRTDTEVLPHLYEDHGADLVQHVDGMFALAVWDDAAKVGILARDRAGKKPLYYHRRGDALYFASEIKALLTLDGFERRINLEALHHFLSLKHVPSPLSIFDGIECLPPAHVLVFGERDGIHIRRYWRPDFSSNGTLERLGEDEWVDQLLEHLRSGVRRRLLSDVPIGFFLSGGIDSSLTTALAAEEAGARIKTFSLAYSPESTTPGKEEDRRWARWVAERYGTEHHEETIRFEQLPTALPAIVRCFDEPFAGVVSTYFLSQLIARHVKVAVSGDGADELFGSYLSHRLAYPLSAFREYERTRDPSLIAPFQDRPAYLASLAAPEDWIWRSKLLVFSEEEKLALYAPDMRQRMRSYSTPERLRRDFSALTATDPLNRILEGEFLTIFPDQVLTFVDRLSMAHSLEVRTAYLDTRFMEFVSRVPGRLKIRDGETKYLLKRAALRFFPPEMVFRRKEGFLMPVADWLSGSLRDHVAASLCEANLRKHSLFDPAAVKRLVASLAQARGDHQRANQVLALLVFQEWYTHYLQ